MIMKIRPVAYFILVLFFSTILIYVPIIQAESETFIPRPALPSELKDANRQNQKNDEELENNQIEEKDDQNELGASSEKSDLNDHSSASDQEAYSEAGLFETDIVIYPLNEFDDRETLKQFNAFVNNDQKLRDQIVLEDVSEDNRYLLAASYTDKAKVDEQLIVLYLSLGIEDKSQAEKALEQNLLLFPDLLVKGELVSQNNTYDLAYGLNVQAEANSFEVNSHNNELYYYRPRNPYTYEVDSVQEDPYRQAIEERFPGQFNFESQEEAGKVQVTMSQIPISEQASDELSIDSITTEEGDYISKMKGSVDNFLNQIHLKEKLIEWGISEENVSLVTMAVTLVLIIIGIVLIVLGFRR